MLNSRCAFHCQINCNFCDRIKNLLCLLIKYTFIYTPLVLLLHSRTKVFMTNCEKKVKPSLKFSTALYLAANSDFATFRYLYYLTTFWINCNWFVCTWLSDSCLLNWLKTQNVHKNIHIIYELHFSDNERLERQGK